MEKKIAHCTYQLLPNVTTRLQKRPKFDGERQNLSQVDALVGVREEIWQVLLPDAVVFRGFIRKVIRSWCRQRGAKRPDVLHNLDIPLGEAPSQRRPQSVAEPSALALDGRRCVGVQSDLKLELTLARCDQARPSVWQLKVPFLRLKNILVTIDHRCFSVVTCMCMCHVQVEHKV